MSKPVKLGSKKIYLPNFQIALLRTKHLPANFAQFLVPLNLNKFDLRDYLLHCYNVEVRGVRSFVQLQKIDQRSKLDPTQARWHRKRSIKKMIVELVQPFVYPKEPADLAPWDNELHKAVQEARKKGQETYGPEGFKHSTLDGRGMKELAEEILRKQGEEGMVEVDRDVHVNAS